jgi:hypothetical protein
VSRIVVVGRQAPAPAAVEACAEALTGAACTGRACAYVAAQLHVQPEVTHKLDL